MSIVQISPGAAITSRLTSAPTGLVGTLGVRLESTGGATVVPRFTAGIVEFDPGEYSAPITAPDDAGDYVPIWDTGGPTPIEIVDEDTWRVVEGLIEWAPTLVDVAALIRARTKDRVGNEVGTFTADTRPTGVEVQAFITEAVNHVSLRAGPRLPDNAKSDARDAAALRAAYRVERSYWPEQLARDSSSYEALKAEYDQLMGDLADTLQDANLATTSRMGSVPALSPTLSAYPDDLRPISPWSP